MWKICDWIKILILLKTPTVRNNFMRYWLFANHYLGKTNNFII